MPAGLCPGQGPPRGTESLVLPALPRVTLHPVSLGTREASRRAARLCGRQALLFCLHGEQQSLPHSSHVLLEGHSCHQQGCHECVGRTWSSQCGGHPDPACVGHSWSRGWQLRVLVPARGGSSHSICFWVCARAAMGAGLGPSQAARPQGLCLLLTGTSRSAKELLSSPERVS